MRYLFSKHFTYALVGFSLFFLTGCIDMLEELTLRKDGSGTYSIRMDLGKLFSDSFMKGMAEDALQSEKNPINIQPGKDLDSTITFAALPDSIKSRMDNPDFWKKVKVKLLFKQSQNIAQVSLNLDFDQLSDIDYLFKNLGDMAADSKKLSALGALNGDEPLLSQGPFQLKGKTLTRLPLPSQATQAAGENLDFVKTFLGSAKYVVVYNMPGKVKKTTIPNSKVSGSMVTVSSTLFELTQRKGQLDGTIKFR